MTKTYRYRLNPTRKQVEALSRTLDLCRGLYNCALEQRRDQRINRFQQMRQLTDVRRDLAEYKTVHVHVLQNVITKLDHSFQGFFRRVKQGGKPGFPRFKGKDRYDSFAFNNVGFSLTGNRLRISKIGSVKMRLSREIKGKIKTCTIRRQNEKWYACFVVEYAPKPLPKSELAIGIDVGVENFAALSNGEMIPNPRFFEQSQAELRRAQRRLARRKKGSHRRRKAVQLLAKLHERIRNRRSDFLHKNTTAIALKYGVIAIEKLNVRGMAQGVLSKQVHDASWTIFFNLLSYKAEEAGRELIEVDSRYTSQDCPNCGHRKKKALAEREHRCLQCGYYAHRDTAAAEVILGRAVPSGAKIGESIPCLA